MPADLHIFSGKSAYGHFGENGPYNNLTLVCDKPSPEGKESSVERNFSGKLIKNNKIAF